MDAEAFDRLVRALTQGRTRRGLLALLAGVPLVGPLVFLLDEEGEAAKRRQQVQDAKKKKKKCAKAGQPTSKKRKKCCYPLVKDGSGVCNQSCASGPPPCPVCTICDAQIGQCVPQPDGFGCFLPNNSPCDNATFACQSGTCVPAPVVCDPPEQCQEPGICELLPQGQPHCVYANKADDTPCDTGTLCTTNDVCTDGVCAGTPLANGTECGTQAQPGGGTTRCCNGLGCPEPTCLPGGQPCDSFDNCRDSCCTGGTFGQQCPGPACVCAIVIPGGPCASDADCRQGHCVCHACCGLPGAAVEGCEPSDCCSGTCADNDTCA